MDVLDGISFGNLDFGFPVDFRLLENYIRALEWGRLRSIDIALSSMANNWHRKSR